MNGKEILKMTVSLDKQDLHNFMVIYEDSISTLDPTLTKESLETFFNIYIRSVLDEKSEEITEKANRPASETKPATFQNSAEEKKTAEKSAENREPVDPHHPDVEQTSAPKSAIDTLQQTNRSENPYDEDDDPNKNSNGAFY